RGWSARAGSDLGQSSRTSSPASSGRAPLGPQHLPRTNLSQSRPALRCVEDGGTPGEFYSRGFRRFRSAFLIVSGCWNLLESAASADAGRLDAFCPKDACLVSSSHADQRYANCVWLVPGSRGRWAWSFLKKDWRDGRLARPGGRGRPPLHKNRGNSCSAQLRFFSHGGELCCIQQHGDDKKTFAVQK